MRAWAPFVVDAVSYAVSCLTLSRIRTDLRPQPREGAPTRPVEQVKEGYRFIRGQPFFRTLMVWATINNLVVNACFFVVMMRLVREGVQPAQIGLVSTFAGIGGILGALAAPYVIDRLRTGTLTVAVGWMCVLPLRPAGVVVDAVGGLRVRVPPPAAQPGGERRASAPTARR